MLKKYKKHIGSIIILLCLSLLPFYWLRGGYVIAGHDAGLPLSPKEHFIDRLSTWTYRYDSGTDQSFSLGGFFIHGLEFLFDLLPLSLSIQQSIEFSLYFFMIGLSMYISIFLLFPHIRPHVILFGSIIYQFNHFILQAWFIVERTKFTTYIALPLVAVLFIKTIQRKQKPYLTGLYSAIIMTIFNGGGFLPLYGAIIITIAILTIYSVLFVSLRKQTIIRISTFYITSIICYAVLNAYWLLPYYFYAKSSFSNLVTESGGISGVINWVKSISENTSIINLFRLQGIQEWYVNTEHPYAQNYLSNPLLIVSSFVPLFIIIKSQAELARKKSTTILMLMVVLLISLIMMAGSHPPFGWLYLFLIKHLPGFVAFRTPYYKFAPAFIFSFSIISTWLLSLYISKNKRYKLISFIIIFLYLGYHYPFFTSNFFQYTNTRTTKIKPPSYIYEYADYISNNPDNIQRTLIFPGLNQNNLTSEYTWGYWSLAPLHSLLDTHQYVLPQSGNNPNLSTINELYQAIQHKQSYWLEIANNIGIDSLLIEKDFIDNYYDGIESNSIIEYLTANKSLTPLQTFGPWEIYKINESTNNLADNYLQIKTNQNQKHLYQLIFQNLQPKSTFVQTSEKVDILNRIGLLSAATCRDCQMRREQAYIANPNVVFSPGSKIDLIGQLIGINYQFSNEASNSLQQLYIIQSMINKKQPSAVRVTIWDQYITSLDKYRQNVEKEIQQIPTTNQNLVHYFSNIQFQKNIMKDVVSYVNTVNEANKYNAALEIIQNIESKILSSINITTKPNIYELAVPIEEEGEYSVFVHSQDLNGSLNNEAIKLDIDDRKYSYSFATNSAWVNLATIPLDQKTYNFTIEDVPYQKTKLPQLSVNIGGDHICQQIFESILNPGLYTLKADILSPKSDSNITIHISSTKEQKPLLPFWGYPIELKQNTNRSIVIPFDQSYQTVTTIDICAHSLKSNQPFYIDNLNLDRQTSPEVIFYQAINPSTQSQSNYNIERSNTENSYLINTSTVGVINTNHPYNPGWKIDNENDKKLIINNNMEGILVNSDSPTIIHETYQIQRFYILGWKISLTGYFIILVLIITRKIPHNNE